MARDTTELLGDILRSANDALEYTAGLDSKTFVALPHVDRKNFRAIKNALSEMGEAVKRLPQEVTDRSPSVKWRGLAGLRDVLAHQYHKIEMEMLWPVVAVELPALVQVVEAELEIHVVKPPTPGGR